MKAIRTKSGKWVDVDPFNDMFYTSTSPRIFNELYAEKTLEQLRVDATVETGEDCELVEVLILTPAELEQRERDAFEAGFQRGGTEDYTSMQLEHEYKDWSR